MKYKFEFSETGSKYHFSNGDILVEKQDQDDGDEYLFSEKLDKKFQSINHYQMYCLRYNLIKSVA